MIVQELVFPSWCTAPPSETLDLLPPRFTSLPYCAQNDGPSYVFISRACAHELCTYAFRLLIFLREPFTSDDNDIETINIPFSSYNENTSELILSSRSAYYRRSNTNNTIIWSCTLGATFLRAITKRAFTNKSSWHWLGHPQVAKGSSRIFLNMSTSLIAHLTTNMHVDTNRVNLTW